MTDATIKTTCSALAIAVTLLAMLLPTAAADAQIREPSRGFGRPAADDDLVSVTIFTDADRVEPLKTFHLVILFDIKESWHLYWKNPGAGAAPIEVEVRGPSGFEVEPVRWPRPSVIASSTGDMYAYESQLALFVPITAPQHFQSDALMLHYDLAWAVCDEQRCVMQTRAGFLPVSGSSPLNTDSNTSRKAQIQKHRKRLPTPADDAEDVEVTLDGSTLQIAGPAMGFDTATLLPNPSPGVSFGKPNIEIEDDRFVLTVEIASEPRNFSGTKPTAGGLIALGEDATDPSFEFAIPLAGSESR